MKKFKLANKDRSKAFFNAYIEHLELNKLKINVLENKIETIFFEKLPSSYKNNSDEWNTAHCNHKWRGSNVDNTDSEEYFSIIKLHKNFPSSGKHKNYTLNDNIHTFEQFSSLCRSVIDLEHKINIFLQYEQRTKACTSTNQDIALNEHFIYDSLNKNTILCLLLGLDPKKMYLFFDSPEKHLLDANHELLHELLEKTDESKLLNSLFTTHNEKSFIEGNYIFTKQLIKWLLNNQLIVNSNESIKPSTHRNYSEAFAKELHKQLTDYNFISGTLNEMWIWKAKKNALPSLANKLSSEFPEECSWKTIEVDLLAYIINPSPNRLSQVKPSTSRAILTNIDLVISALKKIPRNS